MEGVSTKGSLEEEAMGETYFREERVDGGLLDKCG